MDISVVVVIWLVVVVIQNLLDKKSPKPPTELPPNETENFPGFKIPSLANDPNFPGEENSILVQDTTQSAEVREVNLAELYRQKKLFSQTENKFSASKTQMQTEIPVVEKKPFTLDITPSATMNAIILGEILSKPKFKK